jgi:hypothetical protein
MVCYCSPNITIRIKSRWIRRTRLVASIRKKKVYKGFWEGSLKKLNHVEGLAVEDNIKMYIYIIAVKWERVEWFSLEVCGWLL